MKRELFSLNQCHDRVSMVWALLYLLGYISTCNCVCTYPSDLVGEWYSTSFGLLTFTSTSFSGFTSVLSATPLTFSCDVSSGTQYVSKTTNTLFGGVTVDTYLCMNFQQLSNIKYVFTLDSNKDSGTGLRFYTSSATSVSVSEACTFTDTRSPGEYELLILANPITQLPCTTLYKNFFTNPTNLPRKADGCFSGLCDNINEAFTSCPSDLLTSFSVVMSTQSVTDCNGTSLQGAASQLAFNYSSCVSGIFNNGGGILNCLYSVSSDFTYVNLYNNDSGVDGVSIFRFTCLVFTTNEANVSATEYPNSCSFNQTATYVVSPGLYYSMINLLYVPPEEENDSNNVTIIVVAVVCCVALVIIVIVVIAIYFKECRKPRPQPPPTPPKERKRKRKPSITDYTPRLSRTDSIEKEFTVRKISTGEVITGTLTDKKALIDGNDYEPPTKKAWQKKWETKMRPSTPIWRSSSESLNQANSSSLPDNLDKTINFQEGNTSLHHTKSVSADNLRYSERSHSATKVPESTGKFGNSPSPRIRGSITSVFDSTLEPIRENPLSREVTPTDLRRFEVASSARTDERSLLSTAFTTSTLSARDINLMNYSNLRRSSRLSASNASIFDDPTWLNENSKKTDRFFNVVKNLIPGLPSSQIRDQKWFIKAPPTQEVSREDIAYFQSRNKRTIGISASGGLRSNGRHNEKRKKDTKTKTKTKIVRPALPQCED